MRPGLFTGHNVDPVDVRTGLRELEKCGYTDSNTQFVIEHALMRWSRGEEKAAQRGAIDRSFYGIDLTSWYRVLSASIHAGSAQ